MNLQELRAWLGAAEDAPWEELEPAARDKCRAWSVAEPEAELRLDSLLRAAEQRRAEAEKQVKELEKRHVPPASPRFRMASAELKKWQDHVRVTALLKAAEAVAAGERELDGLVKERRRKKRAQIILAELRQLADRYPDFFGKNYRSAEAEIGDAEWATDKALGAAPTEPSPMPPPAQVAPAATAQPPSPAAVAPAPKITPGEHPQLPPPPVPDGPAPVPQPPQVISPAGPALAPVSTPAPLPAPPPPPAALAPPPTPLSARPAPSTAHVWRRESPDSTLIVPAAASCRRFTAVRSDQSGRLHCLAVDRATFGRRPTNDVVLRAIHPEGPKPTALAVMRLSGVHFTIVREGDAVLVVDGEILPDGQRKPSSGGTFHGGAPVDRTVIAPSGRHILSLASPAGAPDIVHWELTLYEAAQFSVSFPRKATALLPFRPTEPAALYMRRLDGLHEDVLLLWRLAELKTLGLDDRLHGLFNLEKGIYSIIGNAVSPIEPESSLGCRLRVRTSGRLEFEDVMVSKRV